MTALSHAQPGMCYTIKWNVCHGLNASTTEKLHLIPGETLYLLNSYFGSVIVCLRGKRIALSREIAYSIKV